MLIEDINRERFKKYVHVVPGECWHWLGAHIPSGYASFNINGKQVGAHRVAWALEHEKDPGEFIVRHTCDNPGCVNPAHLIIGTQRDNMMDRMERTGYQRGESHALSRLTSQDVVQIRSRIREGYSFYSEAERLGINSGTVYDAAIGNSWAHVQDPITREELKGIKRKPRPSKYTSDDVDAVMAMRREGKSWPAIDKIMGWPNATSWKIAHK